MSFLNDNDDKLYSKSIHIVVTLENLFAEKSNFKSLFFKCIKTMRLIKMAVYFYLNCCNFDFFKMKPLNNTLL